MIQMGVDACIYYKREASSTVFFVVAVLLGVTTTPQKIQNLNHKNFNAILNSKFELLHSVLTGTLIQGSFYLVWEALCADFQNYTTTGSLLPIFVIVLQNSGLEHQNWSKNGTFSPKTWWVMPIWRFQCLVLLEYWLGQAHWKYQVQITWSELYGPCWLYRVLWGCNTNFYDYFWNYQYSTFCTDLSF